jgi:hypothetical protein
MSDSFLEPFAVPPLAERMKSRSVRWGVVLHGLGVGLLFLLLFTAFFLPALVSGRLLAPGDGFIESLPAFLSPFTLWSPLLLSGFPVAADMANMAWYPLSLLLGPLDLWNAFVISAYVLASLFTYAYVLLVTGSRFAGFISGIVYGLGGFMVAHLGHTMIIHTAAWFPLLLLGLEALRRGAEAHGFILVAVAVACSALAGHPQIFVNMMLVGSAYALFTGWPMARHRWRYYGLSLAGFVLGGGLAALQLIPTRELGQMGLHWRLSFQDFVSYALPPAQALHLLFPYLFGGPPESPYGIPYFGSRNQTELSGYFGLLPALLAGLGFWSFRQRRLAGFWTAVAVAALLLAVGDATPLAHGIYHVPILNKFRAPARHFLELSFAASALAGFGVAAIQSNCASRRGVMTVIGLGGAVLLAGLGIVLTFAERLRSIARTAGIESLDLLPSANPAIGFPLAVFVLAATALAFWSRRPRAPVRRAALTTVLLLDLGSFGWFLEWRYLSPEDKVLETPDVARRYAALTRESQARILPVRGGFGELTALPPNLSRLWEVPSASGYGPFILARMSELLSMGTPGHVTGAWWSAENRSLDVMSVRYVFAPQSEVHPPRLNRKGVEWSGDDLPLVLGVGCGANESKSVRLMLGRAVNATAVGIVSALGCSQNLPDGTRVARITVTDARGASWNSSLRAGVETSEWAHDCPDVTQGMRHRRTAIFESYSVARTPTTSCLGHKYVAVLPLEGVGNVHSVDLAWAGQPGALAIQKVSLLNDIDGTSYPITSLESGLTDGRRWREIERLGSTVVFENLRAQPRAWLVPEVVSASPREVLTAIRSSEMPDGRSYEPGQLAFVEEPRETSRAPRDPSAQVSLNERSDYRLEVRTRSRAPGMLVVSDAFYPGWRATIDGERTEIVRVNYVMRGVRLPAGDHLVEFVYRPASVYVGAFLSAASFLLVGACAYGLRQRSPETSQTQAAAVPTS